MYVPIPSLALSKLVPSVHLSILLPLHFLPIPTGVEGEYIILTPFFLHAHLL